MALFCVLSKHYSYNSAISSQQAICYLTIVALVSICSGDLLVDSQSYWCQLQQYEESLLFTYKSIFKGYNNNNSESIICNISNQMNHHIKIISNKKRIKYFIHFYFYCVFFLQTSLTVTEYGVFWKIGLLSFWSTNCTTNE